ncbi:M20/M25/M40 family metallo-hydrolase [Paucilactobacillus wasatchensis]|uniref:Acetylornithine deacetylase n=1 Tax=Paucilactobacillus wasatchensis TaxID=1335616 RepID=A0A0D0Y4T1_9LACO|nr:M20/M25/M40 family metallo-hydrolase [Paucilactobacillus wasatchensis]KIS03298.1 Acetylornithine deacetylase [Paucilactobacillus wasatchensis]
MDQQEKIGILSDLIGFRTVGGDETQVANYLIKLFSDHGIKSQKVKYAENRDNLVVQIGNGQGPVLAFSGHQDVVAEGDLASWDSDPFKAKITDDRIYGRGTSDMKAGLAAMVIAIIELHENNQALNGTLRFMATIEEEVGELGSHQLLTEGYANDIDALITGEPTVVPTRELSDYFASGAARIDPDDLAQLTEKVKTDQTDSEQNFVFYAHKGWIMTTVTSYGKAAHSSMPGLGINAIDGIVKYYEEEKKFYAGLTATSPILGKTIYAPTVIKGGQQVNSIPDVATLQAKIRTIPEASNDWIIEQLQQIINRLNEDPKTNLKLEYDSKLPVLSDANSKLVQVIRKVTKDTIAEPLPAIPLAVSLGTDASELSQGNDHMQIAIIGPGNNTAHQANEYVTKKMYFEIIDTYEAVAREYLK